jgi:hypothetical protein
VKKVLIVFVLGFAIFGFLEKNPDFLQSNVKQSAATDQLLATAYQNQQSDLQVKGKGRVIRTLPDDTEGSRHQKFVLELSSGQTLLISHNIDVAPRINSLREGDTVEFYGEYEWSSKGGVVHWTHHDPGGRHKNGWLKRKGTTYQ